MRSVMKLQFRNLHQAKITASSKFQAFRFSGPRSFEELPESTETQQFLVEKNAAGYGGFSSQILGSEELIPICGTSVGVSISETANSREDVATNVLSSSTKPVCENAHENDLQHKARIIHEITALIHAQDDAASMEERLESSGLRFDSFIVEKVLKRCFKKPHSAWRFFNWVKLRHGFRHTTETYHAMLQIAGQAKEFELMEEVVKEIEKNSSCVKDLKTWTIVISHYRKAKLFGEASLAFEKMKKCGCELDAMVYSRIIDALCSAGKPDIAMEFYKETVQKKLVLSFAVYRTIMNCMAGSGDPAAVHSIADDLVQLVGTHKRTAYGHMLESFCISGKITDALEAVCTIKDQNLPIVPEYCETLIKGLCRVGWIEDALPIVAVMVKRGFVKANMYRIIADGYFRRNDVSEPLDMFGCMKEGCHVPTRSTYKELIQKVFGLNEYQKQREVFDNMVQKGSELDFQTINAMVSGHVSRNDISKAWDMLRKMEARGVKSTYKFYSVFINELCKFEKTDEIIKVLSKMQASDFVMQDELFQTVISYLKKKGVLENLEMGKNLQKICKNQIGPPLKAGNENEATEISLILISSSDWRSVEEALEEHVTKFTPALVLEILRCCKFHGPTALNFFHWVGKQHGYMHTTETYNMAINIAGSSEDFEHMRSLFREMKTNGLPIMLRTWTILIMQYGGKGLTGMALQIFEQMKANGVKPIRTTYKFLITSLCGKKGMKVDVAIRLFQELIGSDHVPDKYLVETYLTCLFETKRISDARKCIDFLIEVGFTSELIYSWYIKALCRAQNLNEALKLVNKIGTERKELCAYVHTSIVVGLLMRGELDAALAKVDEMRQAGIRPTVHVYTPFIVHFFKKKQVDRAMEIFEKMKAEGCEPTVVTYTVIIQGYLNSGKVDEACSVFNQMKKKGPAPDYKTYEAFITGLCEIGRSEEALKHLPGMFRRGIALNSPVVGTIFLGLTTEEKKRLARKVLQEQKLFRGRQRQVDYLSDS